LLPDTPPEDRTYGRIWPSRDRNTTTPRNHVNYIRILWIDERFLWTSADVPWMDT
jgi:hypothetical protein